MLSPADPDVDRTVRTGSACRSHGNGESACRCGRAAFGLTPKTANTAEAAPSTTPAPQPPAPVAAECCARECQAAGRLRQGARRRCEAGRARVATRRTPSAPGRRRRYRQPREQELDAVERAVARIPNRGRPSWPTRWDFETPRIRLFDRD